MTTDAITTESLLDMYRAMVRIRAFEEQLALCVEAGEVKTPCHLYIGQEAIAAGVCHALERADTVWGGHRSHGHYLAKGGSLSAMMAEIFGRRTGCARGRGGSMHLVAPEVGVLGTVPLVAATIPLAVGAALAARLKAERQVAVAFFGDGATDEGHYYESLNLAALYRLPVLFVCENNMYSSHMRLDQHRLLDNLAAVGQSAGLASHDLDGNDVLAVHAAARDAVTAMRTGGAPVLLVCRTYRWRGHVGPSWDMDVGVKRRDELADWLPLDPIARSARELVGRGVGEAELERISGQARDEVQAALYAAREAPFPDVAELGEHVYVQTRKDS